MYYIDITNAVHHLSKLRFKLTLKMALQLRYQLKRYRTNNSRIINTNKQTATKLTRILANKQR